MLLRTSSYPGEDCVSWSLAVPEPLNRFRLPSPRAAHPPVPHRRPLPSGTYTLPDLTDPSPPSLLSSLLLSSPLLSLPPPHHLTSPPPSFNPLSLSFPFFWPLRSPLWVHYTLSAFQPILLNSSHSFGPTLPPYTLSIEPLFPDPSSSLPSFRIPYHSFSCQIQRILFHHTSQPLILSVLSIYTYTLSSRHHYTHLGEPPHSFNYCNIGL